MPDQLQLAVTGAPLPPDFVGTPQEYYEAILTRMRVIFPTGQTSFVISDTEPSTNLGPWLKGGTKWYVWNDDTKRYVPLDISDSLNVVSIAETAPADGTKPLWLQIKGTRVVRWNAWLDTGWKPLYNRGTTAQRPTDPVDYERYEDTDISAEIVFYSGSWHTVSGSTGDIKYVTWPTLDLALQYNPGWREIGQYFADPNTRGRAFTPAHKDAGGTPATILSAGAGITQRAAGEKFGEEAHVLTNSEAQKAPHQHLIGERKDLGSNDIELQLVEPQSFSSAISGADRLEVLGEGFGDGFMTGNVTTGDIVSSNPIYTGAPAANDAHNTLQPTMALWCLVKV